MEEQFKNKKHHIEKIVKELKSHYFGDFFVDPDKKFISLLDKLTVSLLKLILLFYRNFLKKMISYFTLNKMKSYMKI